MKRIYYTPELEVTKFDFKQVVRTDSPTDPGNITTAPFTSSDPEVTGGDIGWGDW